MIQSATFGFLTIYRRRLAVATKTVSDLVGQLAIPVLWVLVIASALDAIITDFRPIAGIDYYTYLAVGLVALQVPFTSTFSGLNVIIDKEFGITREFLVAPVQRALIPLANAMAVLTIALTQTAIIIGLGVARGANLDTSPAGIVWFLAATILLTLTTYGLAEVLALTLKRFETYYQMLPVVAVTPWFLAGSFFPISSLPAGLEQVTLALPWTHALALMRYGLIEGSDPGLANIWHLDSELLMASLSLIVMVTFTVVMLGLAVRVFYQKTMA